MLSLALLIGLTIPVLGGYLVWPSRWNIPAHSQVGMLFVSFFVPLVMLDGIDDYDPQLLDQYLLVVLGGAAGFLLGLPLGFHAARVKTRFSGFGSIDPQGIESRCLTLAALCCGVILLCFLYMGFIPMFADDPFAAKFFKGPYQERYRPVAFFYQTARQIIVLLVPLLMALWLYGKSRRAFVALVISAVLYSLQLTRGGAMAGVLLFLSIPFIRRGLPGLFAYLLVNITAFCLGSAIFFVIGIWTDTSLDFFGMLAQGAPDINDHLDFLDAYNNRPDLTFGRTVFGGLIPFQYEWNPAIWSLAVLNNTSDVSEISSGGLRLPPGLWGYVSFSWIGVMLMPLLGGAITGYFLRDLKDRIRTAGFDPLRIAIALQVYSTWVGFLGGLTLSIYSLPAIAVLFLLTRDIRLRGAHA